MSIGDQTAVQRAQAPVGAITYDRPAAFWAGIVAVTGGVLLHLPMYLQARSVHYRLVGMAVDRPMVIGMVVARLCAGAQTFRMLYAAPTAIGRCEPTIA